jgi:hypothetical protein
MISRAREDAAGVLLRDGELPATHVRRAVERLRARPLLSPLAWLAYDELRATVTIEASKIDFSQLTALRIALRQRLQDAVGRTMGQTTIIRDLATYDITGVANAAANYARLSNKNALVANTWLVNDWSTVKVPINTALGIYGYEQLTAIPNIDAIAFTIGGNVAIAQFWLDGIYTEQTQSIGYFDPPVVFSPQQPMGVNLLASAAVSAGAESFGLKGYTCEPAANTVAPDQSNLV